jgi:hypothetical protein
LGIAKEERGEFLQASALAVGEVVGNELRAFHAEGSKAVALLGGEHEMGEGYLDEVETGDVGRLGDSCEYRAVIISAGGNTITNNAETYSTNDNSDLSLCFNKWGEYKIKLL